MVSELFTLIFSIVTAVNIDCMVNLFYLPLVISLSVFDTNGEQAICNLLFMCTLQARSFFQKEAC